MKGQERERREGTNEREKKGEEKRGVSRGEGGHVYEQGK